MIYPLLPVFMATVLGAGALQLGVVEGVAEGIASLLKVFSGVLSDRMHQRKRLMVWGYSISSAVKPLMALAGAWPMVLLLRFLDRVGKGIRSSPRDALMSDIVPRQHWGSAFGFHRAMDNAGAVVGPLVAAALLTWGGLGLRDVFALAAVPSLLVVLLVVFGVQDPPPASTPARPKESLREGWHRMGTPYKRLLLAILVFTLGAASEAFLLLQLSRAGIPPAGVAALWAGHNAIRSGISYWGGWLSDKLGRKRLVAAGWLVFMGVFATFPLVSQPWALSGLFLLYGVFFGLTEATQRAWVSDLVGADLRGTAFGYYHGAIGLATLPASLLFGFLHQQISPHAAFFTSVALAGLALLLLLRVPHQGGGQSPPL